jgi:hypothetical protein
LLISSPNSFKWAAVAVTEGGSQLSNLKGRRLLAAIIKLLMRLYRADREAARTQESEESLRYPLKPFELKFEKIHPTPHPNISLLSSHSPSELDANSRLTGPSKLRTPESKSENYESDFESYASIVESESVSIYESVAGE